MTTRRACLGWVWLLGLLCMGHAARAQEGQADLDAAIDRKIAAESMQDLAEVAALCEKALQKGLAADEQVLARQLLAGALYERATRLCRPVTLGVPLGGQAAQEVRARALPDLEKILRHNPQFGPAHLLIAQLQSLEGGDAQQARKSVDLAIEYLADNHPLLADALLFRSRLQSAPEDALADLNRAVELNPDDPAVWQARAVHYLAQGDTERAVHDLNSLIEKNSGNMLLRLFAADLLIKADQCDEALRYINQAIDKEPTAQAYGLRAQLWAAQRKYDEAIKDLDEAIKLDPDDLGLVLRRAQVHYLAEHHELAYQDVQRVLEEHPDVLPVIEFRSAVLAALGKYAEAARDISRLLEKEPDNPLLKLQLAVYLNAGNQSRQAIEIFTDVLRADPQNGVALRGRADAYLNIGEHGKAVADYEVVVKMFPDDDGILNNFAWVLATSPDDSLRNGKRALEMGLKACELTQYKEAHILSTLAAAYAETGDFENAVSWSQKSVDLGDSSILEQLKQELESYRQRKPWREKKDEAAP